MTNLNAEAFTMLAIAMVFIGVRLYVRVDLVGWRDLQVDDYLMPVAGIVFVLETVAAYTVRAYFGGLTNSFMTDEQRAALDPDSEEHHWRVMGSKVQVLGWSLYVMLLWMLKLCITMFYGRLTNGLTHLALRIRVGYGLIAVTYLATALSLLLSCQPFHRFWQVNPDPGNLCQPTISKVYVWVAVVLNVLTDMYLLSIPLPLLWKVRIGLRQKISLMVLFGGGVFVIMASIIRAVSILTSGPDGAVAGSSWACRETFVSIVITNLPIIHPLLRRGAQKIGLSTLFSSYAHSRKYPLSGQELQSSHKFSKRGATHPLSIPAGTAWGSDEQILPAGEGTGSKDITVVQETTVVHTHVDAGAGHRPRESQASPPKTGVFAPYSEQDYQFSVSGGRGL